MYDITIGLEIHVQLNTKTKIFCGCSTEYTELPNTHTCPICQGHPGTFPLLNKEVIQKAVKAAIATNCKINQESLFDRKGYFYPDLPKGYQTTQFYSPICEDGYVKITKSDGSHKKIRIHHIHMEEDAGKLVHSNRVNESYVDLNRAATPLLEIVSQPDITSIEEAVLFATHLRQLMIYAGVTDGNMQEGSVRFDLNLSVKPQGSDILGTRTETKNLNSFTALKKAIEMEYERQTSILKKGGVVEQETRLFNLDKMESRTLRKKGDGEEGYLYFRDPDIPPVIISDEWLKTIKDSMPPLPQDYLKELLEDFKIKTEDAEILLSEKEYVLFFKEAVKGNESESQRMANLFLTDLLGTLKDKGLALSKIPLTPEKFGGIFQHIISGEISLKIAKDLLPIMVETGKTAKELITEKGLVQISDISALENIIKNILSNNIANVEAYKAGKKQVLGFFVGQVMKETKGQANPGLVNEILTKLLDE